MQIVKEIFWGWGESENLNIIRHPITNNTLSMQDTLLSFTYLFFFFARLAKAWSDIGGVLFALNGKHRLYSVVILRIVVPLNSASGLFPEITSRLQNQSESFPLSDQI